MHNRIILSQAACWCVVFVMLHIRKCAAIVIPRTASRDACHFTHGAGKFRLAQQRSNAISTTCRPNLGAFRRSTPIMMPEGPEVRTLVDQLQPAVGMRLVELRFLSGRYVRHGRPKGFDDFRLTMTPFDRSSVGGGSGTSTGDKTKHIDGKDQQHNGDDEEDLLEQALSITSTARAIDVVTEWNCKGKFIYIILDDGNPTAVTGENGIAENDYMRSLWITLGMSGKFVSEASSSADGYMHDYSSNSVDDSARWYLDFFDPHTERTRRIYYHDTRNFGTLRFCLSETELMKKLKSLGPDILDERTTADDFISILDKVRPTMNICKLIMNQQRMSGVGNYILAEGLYRANIDPFCTVSELSEEQKRTLFDELQATAQISYASQGLTRTKGGSYRTPDGQRGKFEFNLLCYGKDVDPRGRPVIRETNGPHGRTIWYVEDQLFVPRASRSEDGQILENATAASNAPKASPTPKEAIKISKPKAPPPKRGFSKIGQPVSDILGNEVDRTDLSFSSGDLASGIRDEGWKDALSSWTSSANFSQLSEFVQSERESGAEIFPPGEEVFSALNMCPLDDVKVVIVGQDPYHGPGQGHGMAFSVKPGVRPPPSLQNIFKELVEDIGIESPRSGYLKCWAEQGVLLLNSVLTVRRGEANSHARMGWEAFTDEIISYLNNEKDDLVFLLWGGPAQKKASGVDDAKHTVIKTSHPSPLGATKSASPFLGSRCFSRANAALIEAGLDPIDWNVR